MKIERQNHGAQRGSAVIVILTLLFIMVVFVGANTVTVNWLRHRVKLVEQQQTRRLAAVSRINQVVSK